MQPKGRVVFRNEPEALTPSVASQYVVEISVVCSLFCSDTTRDSDVFYSVAVEVPRCQNLQTIFVALIFDIQEQRVMTPVLNLQAGIE